MFSVLGQSNTGDLTPCCGLPVRSLACTLAASAPEYIFFQTDVAKLRRSRHATNSHPPYQYLLQDKSLSTILFMFNCDTCDAAWTGRMGCIVFRRAISFQICGRPLERVCLPLFLNYSIKLWISTFYREGVSSLYQRTWCYVTLTPIVILCKIYVCYPIVINMDELRARYIFKIKPLSILIAFWNRSTFHPALGLIFIIDSLWARRQTKTRL